ncbi:MAG: hypothetical protein GF353_08830 [Candidatus Lokiarchaeota archaeon]|nr:hypothetical protein [Candidatus Lokiarchaeota archaeon]
MISQVEGYVDPYRFVGGLNMTTIIIIILIIALCHFVFAIITYFDARKRISLNTRFWTIIVALSGFIGFLIYFYRRNKL